MKTEYPDNTDKFHDFRKKFGTFVYRDYEIQETPSRIFVTYHFEIPGLGSFSPDWTFPKKEGDSRNYRNNETLQRLVFSLGMAELVSYWKTVCPPEVLVEAGELTQEQIAWWKKLYFLGLGEFFYTNGIDQNQADFFDSFMKIVPHKRESDGSGDPAIASTPAQENMTYPGEMPGQNDRYLIPVGGGKDSAVTIELLKKAGKETGGFIINPRGATKNTVIAAGYPEDWAITPKRTLDAFMLRLNRKGCLNGHTPFSAIVSFSSVIAAFMHGFSWIALSNESSANESTVPGSTVNHQYSKSFEYEKDFCEYEKKYLKSGIHYFSLLRPLSEFQIGKYFASCKQYHSIFRSCNAGSKEDIWCGHCPKCLFVACILSPFLSEEELTRIFGKNMLQDVSLLGTLWKLTGMVAEKPFECVGSRDEVNTALCLTIRQREEKGEELPALLKAYRNTELYRKTRSLGDAFSGYYNEEHLVPEELLRIVMKYCVS